MATSRLPFWAAGHCLAVQPSAQHSPSPQASTSFQPQVLVLVPEPRPGMDGLPGPSRPVDLPMSLGLGTALFSRAFHSVWGGDPAAVGDCQCGPSTFCSHRLLS